jgi:spore maturation protein CgeB
MSPIRRLGLEIVSVVNIRRSRVSPSRRGGARRLSQDRERTRASGLRQADDIVGAMRILYVGLAHDYGKPERGPSFEEMNFRSAFEGMGHEVVAYDFGVRQRALGQRRMNAELVEVARRADPDLVFFFLFGDEIPPSTVAQVGQAAGAPTMNWFADDHWRFELFSSRYAAALDWVITTDPAAVERYHALGTQHVILSQWACNRYAYAPTGDPLAHEVTFIGQPHGDRRAVIDRLQASGHRVECWGVGWPSGRIGHDEMVRIFSTSRINLSLSNSATPPNTLRVRVGRLLGRGPSGPLPNQIKGRTFEVPGCGGFLLTERVPNLEDYFEIGEEIAVFSDAEDLLEQVDRWLGDEDARVRVARAGYERVMREHTYDHRFDAIFRTAGLLSAAETAD